MIIILTGILTVIGALKRWRWVLCFYSIIAVIFLVIVAVIGIVGYIGSYFIEKELGKNFSDISHCFEHEGFALADMILA